MRIALIIVFTGSLAVANTLSNPTFGQPETNCNYTTSAPYTTPTCPVIGDPLQFEIQSIAVNISGSTVSATVNFNYGGGMSMAPFNDGGTQLQVGDLFFYDPADPNAKYQFGVALYANRPHSLNDFIAGDLYSISGNVSLETAQTALNNVDAYYRVTRNVLMVDNANVAPTVDGLGTGVHVSALGNGTTAAEYSVSMQFNAGTDFMNIVNNNNGGIGVAFSAADCGNAILDGVIPGNSAAPEPGGMVLMGIGIFLIGGAGYWRRKSART